MFNLTPQQQAIVNMVMALLAASGPVISLLLIKQGVDATTLNALATWASAVVPAIVSAIVIWLVHTPSSMVKTVGTMQSQGVTVQVDTAVASPKLTAIANDDSPSVAGVQPKEKAA